MKPYSVLYVSMMDYDGRKTTLVRAPDDPIGRVAVQLGRLFAGCEYDCWFDLGLGAIKKPDGSLGRVRLRYSVTFHSERGRMLHYVNGPVSSATATKSLLTLPRAFPPTRLAHHSTRTTHPPAYTHAPVSYTRAPHLP